MGNCKSTSVATAVLIFSDGAIQEFSSPAKVSDVLEKIAPACFVCDADEMEFDDFISAMDVSDEFQPGRLYFALPQRWLAQPLQGEDMAELAVKASAALRRGSGGGEKKARGCCRDVDVVDGLVFVERKQLTSRRKIVPGGGRPVLEIRGGRRGQGVGDDRGRKHGRNLSMIPEDGGTDEA
ncbi:hypothetical protein NMG60_11015369 [Bertholletia excelsa]